MPFIVTPEGKILAQSGTVTKYICKKGGDVLNVIFYSAYHSTGGQSELFEALFAPGSPGMYFLTPPLGLIQVVAIGRNAS